jgi:glycosyltransferase involved in cell wall biosynthesis
VAKIALLQTAIADYRDAFITELSDRLDGSFLIFTGRQYFEPSTQTSAVVVALAHTRIVENWFLAARRLCWQALDWSSLLRAEVVVAELNPRIISTWFLLLLRGTAGKRTVLWGHAWSRKGSSSRSEPIRHLMRLSASGVLLYTNTQRDELIARYPKFRQKSWVAPNAIYRTAEIMPAGAGLELPRDFIYVGRLVNQKKVMLLLEAFLIFLANTNAESRLHVVGDGEERWRIEEFLSSSPKRDRVVLHGHRSNLEFLRSLYSKSIASISPGYVGLSITQSFSCGQ